MHATTARIARPNSRGNNGLEPHAPSPAAPQTASVSAEAVFKKDDRSTAAQLALVAATEDRCERLAKQLSREVNSTLLLLVLGKRSDAAQVLKRAQLILQLAKDLEATVRCVADLKSS